MTGGPGMTSLKMKQNTKVNLYVDTRSFSLNHTRHQAPAEISIPLYKSNISCLSPMGQRGCRNTEPQMVQANIYIYSQPYRETRGQNVIPNCQLQQSNLSTAHQTLHLNKAPAIKNLFSGFQGDLISKRAKYASRISTKPSRYKRGHIRSEEFASDIPCCGWCKNLANKNINDKSEQHINSTLYENTSVPLPVQNEIKIHNLLVDSSLYVPGNVGCKYSLEELGSLYCSECFSHLSLDDLRLHTPPASTNLHYLTNSLEKAHDTSGQACPHVFEYSDAVHCSYPVKPSPEKLYTRQIKSNINSRSAEEWKSEPSQFSTNCLNNQERSDCPPRSEMAQIYSQPPLKDVLLVSSFSEVKRSKDLTGDFVKPGNNPIELSQNLIPAVVGKLPGGYNEALSDCDSRVGRVMSSLRFADELQSDRANLCDTDSCSTPQTDGSPAESLTLNLVLELTDKRYLNNLEKHLLSRCFQGWRGIILGKQLSALELSRRHLLQKGINALMWAVILRDAQAEIKHNATNEKLITAYRQLQRGAEVHLQLYTERRLLLQKCFTVWFRKHRNIQQIQHVQRRTLLMWHVYTQQTREREHFIRKQNVLWRGREVFVLWKRRLFQKREVESKCINKNSALLQRVVRGWHIYQQKRKRLVFQLSFVAQLNNENLQRTTLKIWLCRTMKIQQVTLHWQRISLCRYFQLWRKKLIKSFALKEKIRIFQSSWKKLRMKSIFVNWKICCNAKRKAANFQWRREDEVSRKMVERWHNAVLKTRADKHFHGNRISWALTRWRMMFKQRTVKGDNDICMSNDNLALSDIRTHRMMETYWEIWVLQLRLITECRVHCSKALRKRAFRRWAVSARIQIMQREAVLHFQSKTQHQLLLSFFCRWKNKFLSLKKKQHYRTLETLKSVQRWRAATRGRQALNLHSSSSVKEACNYWTNVSSISLHRRNHHATIGSKKMKKVILSIALTIREQRELGCIRLKSNTEWLLQSAFCSWLLTYRRQGAQPALAETNSYTDSSGVYLTEHNTSPPCQEHARELNHKGGLTERMHKFQLRCKMNELRKTWLHWKGLYSTQLVLRELERQRLLKNSWNVWRRRYLQSCTTQQVLAREERCLLYQIFTKWRQNTNRSKKNKYGYTEL